MEQLLMELNRRGVKLRLEGDDLRISAPQGALTSELRDALRKQKAPILALLRTRDAGDAPLPRIEPDAQAQHEPFPLTDLQHAYWLGRGNTMDMGSVATHLYIEFDCQGLEPERLNNALCQLIDRHAMLRAVVDGDGMQRILPIVPRYRIAISDQRQADQQNVDQAIESTRSALSHQVLKADQWPLFDVRITRLPGARLRLHVSLDLLILDAWSIFLFFREWAKLYENPGTALPPLGITFRDYVMAERSLHDGDAHRAAQAYWMARIDTLPPAPQLPIRSDLAARQSPRFSRRQARLDEARWRPLKAAALAHGLTPSGLLLALYSEVLARWSSSAHFTLNVTVSNRLPMHPDVQHLIGDFTSLVLQEVDRRDASASLLGFAQGLQKQFARDLDQRQFSGVSVMREWSRRRGIQLQAVMPVVFSSGLIKSGDDEPGDLEQFGVKVHSISQTSQVWLDHHVMELQGDLVFIWDAADAVFEEDVLDAMFESYRMLIERLADDPALWHQREIIPLPADMQARRDAVDFMAELIPDCKATTLPQRHLHASLVARAAAQPDALAVIAADRSLTYGKLLAESAAVADQLLHAGIQPGQPVAVLMHKGWEQVVAVYGVLLAGGAYMPIDADLPVRRQIELLRIGEVGHILVQPDTLRDEIDTRNWCTHEVRAGATSAYGERHARSLQSPLEQLAYVIFTSGTTGVPKGVMIDHRGAMNTIEHVNRLLGAGSGDRVLGVSSLSFDLSVYDIFGLIDAGGTVVLPDHRKGHDPAHWRELIARHGVTLWNSAPQLMQMLMDSLPPADSASLGMRAVLLSGDFIPLDLPGRVTQRDPVAKVISLGGATEASIWSIYHPIEFVAPGWTSIPYGRPLPNQSVRVYDKAWRVCPDHVAGRICIGGAGLAMGYWRDPERTGARFFIHPSTGERLYDTGDLGRYDGDGNVIILGRDDGQVKVRGHRVELGEIEAVLRQHPAVRQALVVPGADPARQRQLAAYVELQPNHDPQADAATLRLHLAERLPDYMVPRHVVVLERIPVSSNGKVDLRALPSPAMAAHDDAPARVAPRTPTEQVILDAWSRVIVDFEIGVTDNFFELGGDSVMATQLMRELNSSFPVVLEMHELFENLTIESLAAHYDRRLAEGDQGTAFHAAGVGAAERAMADPKAVQEDVARVIAELDGLKFDLHAEVPRPRPRAVLVTGATGWIGGHAVAELLSQTDANIICLVRGADDQEAKGRVVEHLRQCGIAIDAETAKRIEAVCGDLAAPALGLDAIKWRRLAKSVDAIHHFGASLNVTVDYEAHSRANVHSLEWLVRLAVEHHLKPVHAISPMTVCRRHLDDQLVVFADECGHGHPHGLLSTYAQSKWAAEQVLLAAAERGLPVRIYRTSHALPSARTALAKRNDTYNTVLKVACRVGVVPDWIDSRLPGLPVDALCRLMVEDSLVPDDHSGIVHVENRNPLDFKTLLTVLLESTQGLPCDAPVVSLAEWKRLCTQAVEGLSDREEALIKLLFGKRSVGMAVDNIFSNHAFTMHYFEDRGYAPRLTDLTPAPYWHAVRQQAGW